jgi:hypothetical protein
MEDIIVPLGAFAMITGIVVANVWGSIASKREINDTLRRAIDNGQTLDAETIASFLRKPTPTAERDIRGGVTLLFLGFGFVLAGLIAAGLFPGVIGWDSEAGTGFFVAATIIGAIGAGQLVAGLMRRDRKEP